MPHDSLGVAVPAMVGLRGNHAVNERQMAPGYCTRSFHRMGAVKLPPAKRATAKRINRKRSNNVQNVQDRPFSGAGCEQAKPECAETTRALAEVEPQRWVALCFLEMLTMKLSSLFPTALMLLNLDLVQPGVGGDDSWGAWPHDE